MKEAHKNNAFKTPENYFEGFNDRLLNRLQEDNGILPGTDGFKVPQDYFDTLNAEITQKLEQTTAPKVVALHRYRKFFYAAAAIAAVFVLVFGYLQTQNKELTFDNLASSDIESYLDNTDLGFSSYEIAEVVVLDDITMDDILEEQLIEENILEYLDENVDDFEELNLETDE